MKRLEKIEDRYFVFAISLVLIIAAGSLLKPGFYGASDDMHIAWLHQMHEAIKIGQFPPRYVPDLSFGFGYPLFNFVFPLPFYIGEVFHLLGFSLLGSIKTVLLLSIFLSSLFMYKFLRSFSGKLTSFAGAIIYAYTPYRATEIYIRGALGEALSFVFLPMLSLSVYRISRSADEKKHNLFWVGVFSLSFAGLILTHNIVSYMYIPFVFVLFVFYFFLAKNKKRISFYIIFSLFLGLLTSIYFWLPALLESRLVKYDTVFDFWDHYPTIKQLITPYFGYGASVPGPYDGISFFVGHVNIVLILINLILFPFLFYKFKKQERVFFFWFFLLIVISFFMMNHRSFMFWKIIPYISFFQFPWRFLTLVSFATSSLVVFLNKVRLGSLLALVLAICAIFLNAKYFRPEEFLDRSDQYYIEKYIPYPQVSEQYGKIKEEYLRLSVYTSQRPQELYPRFFSQSSVITKVNEKNKLEADAYINSKEDILLNYNKYFFPGWKAKLDGKDVDIFPGSPFGQISFMVPPGEHKISVYHEEPSYKVILDFISLGSLICCLFLIKTKFQLDV